MISKRTKEFKAMLRALPKEVRRQAGEAYLLFRRNPYHNSLQFKQVDAGRSLYAARVGLHYRVIGRKINPDTIVWYWIGSHAEYDKMLK